MNKNKLGFLSMALGGLLLANPVINNASRTAETVTEVESKTSQLAYAQLLQIEQDLEYYKQNGYHVFTWSNGIYTDGYIEDGTFVRRESYMLQEIYRYPELEYDDRTGLPVLKSQSQEQGRDLVSGMAGVAMVSAGAGLCFGKGKKNRQSDRTFYS